MWCAAASARVSTCYFCFGCGVAAASANFSTGNFYLGCGVRQLLLGFHEYLLLWIWCAAASARVSMSNFYNGCGVRQLSLGFPRVSFVIDVLCGSFR